MMSGGAPGVRVLLVAPYYAPSAAVGAKRFAFLAQELERLGHEVHVLTLPLSSSDRRDHSLPSAGRIYRIPSLLPVEVRRHGIVSRAYGRIIQSNLGYPDHFVGWLVSGAVVGRRIVRHFRPEVVIATGPPFTAFLVGDSLSRVSGAALILDYRDPWTAYDWSPSVHGKRMKSSMRRRMEQRVVSSAQAVVFTTDLMRDRFEALHRGPKPKRLEVITNGFMRPAVLEPRALTMGAVNILYAGNFYGERRLAPLMEALKLAESAGVFRHRTVAMHVFGRLKPDDQAHIAALGLEGDVLVHEPVDHAEIIRYMAAADLLFLPSGGDVAYALPFKLFDYLSVRRPILAITPLDSAVARFVSRVDCGEIAPTDDPPMIAAALARVFSRAADFSFAGANEHTWDRVASRYDILIRAVARSVGHDQGSGIDR